MTARSMPSGEWIRALVSVHDVMPETLERVQRILDRCAAINPSPLTLLVVPGVDWERAGIERLRTWQSQGHRLAGHGWLHRAERLGGVGHWLHGLLLSRRVAEHLALDATGVADLICRCHAWFQGQGLGPPDLYVPPAWALGAIRRPALGYLPFDRYEILSGVLDGSGARLRRIPLLGYEADALGRAPLLRLWNVLNRARARRAGWVRIGVHPRDLELALSRDVDHDLRRYTRWVDYRCIHRPLPRASRDT